MTQVTPTTPFGLIPYLAKWAMLLSGGAILLAFAVSSLIGVFFGYYPARKVALSPVNQQGAHSLIIVR